MRQAILIHIIAAMKKTAFILLLSILAYTSQAQRAGFTYIKDDAAVRQKLSAGSKAINAIKADFTQEKELSMLSEKIVSKGAFFFKKENKVRLEYKTPFKYLMVINGSKVLIKDDTKSTKYDTHSNKIFKQVNDLIISSVQGTILNSPDFKVKIYESSGQYLLEMVPVAKGLKEFFSGINILIDKKDYSVSRLEMVELSGDKTTISFSNKELNGKVDDTLFSTN